MIIDNTYEQLALEVLATFELSLGIVAFHRADTIKFQVLSMLHRMSLTNFSIRLGLYDAEFTRPPTYHSHLISWLTSES